MKKFLLGLLVCMFIAMPVSQAVFFGSTDDTASDVDCVDCVDATDIDLSDDYTWTGAHVFDGTFQANGGAVFNEDGADVDFRVESDDAESLFVVDGGSDWVGIKASGANDTTFFRVEDHLGNNFIDAVNYISGGQDEVVVNDSGTDVDFRIESSTNPNHVFLDAFNTRLGMYTNAPETPFHLHYSAGGGAAYNAKTLLALERNGNAYIEMQVGTTDTAGLLFSDDASGVGGMYYNLNSDLMYFTQASTERLRFATSSAVFNEGSEDYDFRIETNSEANAFVVDAGAETATFNVPVTLGTGKNLTVGSTQWNSGDSIDGTKVADADLGDIGVSSGAWSVEDDSHNHVITNIDSFTEAELETQTSDVSNWIQSGEIDAFSEIQALVADKTLVNEEDAATWDSAHAFDSTVTLDLDNAEAFLVRKDTDGGDIFVVDTSDSEVGVSDKLYNIGDEDTYWGFSTADQVDLYVGGVLMAQYVEGASDYVDFKKPTYVTGYVIPTSGVRAQGDADTEIFFNLSDGIQLWAGGVQIAAAIEGATDYFSVLQDLQVTGSSTLAGTIVDVTDTEALLVRKDSDAGDVFVIDTNTPLVKAISDIEIGDAAGDAKMWLKTDGSSIAYIRFNDGSGNEGGIRYDNSDDSFGFYGQGTDALMASFDSSGDFTAVNTIQADSYKAGDGTAGSTDNTSWWLCTAADCSTKCQVDIKDGLVTACT
jgi:hypothetical protein